MNKRRLQKWQSFSNHQSFWRCSSDMNIMNGCWKMGDILHHCCGLLCVCVTHKAVYWGPCRFLFLFFWQDLSQVRTVLLFVEDQIQLWYCESLVAIGNLVGSFQSCWTQKKNCHTCKHKLSEAFQRHSSPSGSLDDPRHSADGTWASETWQNTVLSCEGKNMVKLHDQSMMITCHQERQSKFIAFSGHLRLIHSLPGWKLGMLAESWGLLGAQHKGFQLEDEEPPKWNALQNPSFLQLKHNLTYRNGSPKTGSPDLQILKQNGCVGLTWATLT